MGACTLSFSKFLFIEVESALGKITNHKNAGKFAAILAADILSATAS
jgi:hypothetical protein